MLAKSLVIFIGVGIVAGFAFGVYLIDFKTTTQLVFVEGTSLSIVTEKFDFKQDELIQITIVNSGTNEIVFSDSSYGLKITGLSGILMYSPISSQVFLLFILAMKPLFLGIKLKMMVTLYWKVFTKYLQKE